MILLRYASLLLAAGMILWAIAWAGWRLWRPINRVCSWCGKGMGFTPYLPKGQVSSGMCDACSKAWLKDANL